MHFKSILPRVVLVPAALLGILSVLYLSWQHLNYKKVSLGDLFIEKPLSIQSNNLFDIGVVDFNDDNVYDIFTSNHRSRQSLLRGIGNLEYQDVLSSVQLDHQPEFPGLEIIAEAIVPHEPGLYVYFLMKTLKLIWIPDITNRRVSGKFTLSSPILSQDGYGFKTHIDTLYKSTQIERNIIAFSADDRAEASFDIEFVEIPIDFHIDSSLPLELIKIGSQFVNLKNKSENDEARINRFTLSPDHWRSAGSWPHRFSLFLNDRHGMAWADYNKDLHTDLFISRGGLRGKIQLISEQFNETYRDELFQQKDSKFIDMTVESNIQKQFCPGYNTAWVDYDQDNHLDLFLTCHHNHPYLMYKNRGDGKFQNVAPRLGLDRKGFRTDTPFVWTDTDNDGDLDLFLVTDNGVEKFINNIGHFSRTNTYPISGIIKISINDFDADGDSDLLFASYDGSTSLLENEGREFRLRTAAELNLPSHCLYGNWVDYDNDGITELFIVPHGLFKQNLDKTFRKTGILGFKQPLFTKRARSTWCDLDNDGDLDLLLAVYYDDPLWIFLLNKVLGRYTPKSYKKKDNHGKWDINIYENLADKRFKNNWLQFILKDYQTNTDAIGSTAKINLDDKQYKFQVGQAEGSMTSQGHYRLYLGLGKSEHIASLVINWPDNKTQNFDINDLNQIYEIQR